MIELQNLKKQYGDTEAVRDVNLTIQDGELLVLLGESGSGKTTTLKMINRLIEPTAGKVLIDGRDHTEFAAPELRRSIGYVFQRIGLFPHMTIEQNIAIVPGLLGWSKIDVTDRVTELLEMVQLPPDDFRKRSPSQLSGGQQQRIGVARALAAKPGVMLMDEPFGALDPLTRDQLQDQYRQIHRELNLTSVMVTHDMTEALLMADRIAVMKSGELLKVATPREMLNDPENDYVAALMSTPKRQSDQLEAIANEDVGGP